MFHSFPGTRMKDRSLPVNSCCTSERKYKLTDFFTNQVCKVNKKIGATLTTI